MRLLGTCKESGCHTNSDIVNGWNLSVPKMYKRFVPGYKTVFFKQIIIAKQNAFKKKHFRFLSLNPSKNKIDNLVGIEDLPS